MRRFDGPSSCSVNRTTYLTTSGDRDGLVVGTIIPPNLEMLQQPLGDDMRAAFEEAIRHAKTVFDEDTRALHKEEAKIAEMEQQFIYQGFRDELTRSRRKIEENRLKHAAAKEKAVHDARLHFYCRIRGGGEAGGGEAGA